MATTFIGADTTILLGKESTWGMPVAVTKDIGLVQKVTLNNAREVIESHGAGSRNTIAVGAGTFDLSGSIDFQVQHGRWMEYMLYGGTTNHALTSTDTTHTMVFANRLPSFTMEVGGNDGTGDLVHTLNGCIFHSPKLSLDLNGVLSVSSDFIAKNIIDTTTATAPVINTGGPLTGIQCTLSSGTTIAQLQSLELNFSSSATKSFGIGSALPAAGANHILKTSISGNLTHNVATELEKLLGSTTASATAPTALTYTLAGNNGVTLGSGRKEISIVIGSATMDSYNIDTSLNDLATASFGAKGILGAGSFVDDIASASW